MHPVSSWKMVTFKVVSSLSKQMTIKLCLYQQPDNLRELNMWWTCFYPLSTLLELQRKLGVFWNVKPSSYWFYWLSKKFLFFKCFIIQCFRIVFLFVDRAYLFMHWWTGSVVISTCEVFWQTVSSFTDVDILCCYEFLLKSCE